jgi:hypothetical protein
MVIIDEMNAIPHHTLIALNDFLTHKPASEEQYQAYQKNIASGETVDEAIERSGTSTITP